MPLLAKAFGAALSRSADVLLYGILHDEPATDMHVSPRSMPPRSGPSVLTLSCLPDDLPVMRLESHVLPVSQRGDGEASSSRDGFGSTAPCGVRCPEAPCRCFAIQLRPALVYGVPEARMPHSPPW